MLLLGLGNVLLQDEGLGVRALERLLACYRLPAEVQAVDGGTMGLDLLPYLEQTNSLLIIDAVQTGATPASLVRLDGSAISAALALKISLHQVGLKELLAIGQLQGTLPSRVVLWGMEPASFAWGTELSPSIAGALDQLVHSVAGELRSWGYTIEPRT